MLICPQCQYENDTTNQYCQRCGISLTHKSCHNCGTSVSFISENCPKCGTFTGTVWLAIISQPSGGGELSQLLWEGKYLDLQKRYRFHDRHQAGIDSEYPNQVFQVRVLDSQPLKKSFLDKLLEQNTELLDELERDAQEFQELNPSFWQRLGIAAIAVPYLTLQEITPIVPEVRDTWREKGKDVLLLPDRSMWQLLSELWADPEISSSQIISYIERMAQLWQELSQIRCCQTLLRETNLRVDEQHNFGVQQLYSDLGGTEATLKDLAKIWQSLWNKSKRSEPNLLPLLLQQIAIGKIETIEQVRSHLQDLLHDLEANFLSSMIDPDFDSSVTSSSLEPEPETLIGQLAFEENEEEEGSTVLLGMELSSLADAGVTDIGRKRDCNEDCFGIYTQIKKHSSGLKQKVEARGLYIVCDGMGGHDAGEVASAMAVETLQNYFQTHWKNDLPDEENLSQAVLLANQKIYETNLQNSRSANKRMGTTLVMVLVQNTKVAIAHVGDSRIYQVTRKRGLELLTLDHQVGQWEIQRGVKPEIAYARPDAYQLTQALGPRDNDSVKPDIKFLELNEDVLLLLCSDGLSDNDLIETHWETYLSPLISSRANLEQGLLKLIDFANQNNGHDNITGVLVRIKFRPSLDSKSTIY
jgi:protein phosphatase